MREIDWGFTNPILSEEKLRQEIKKLVNDDGETLEEVINKFPDSDLKDALLKNLNNNK